MVEVSALINRHLHARLMELLSRWVIMILLMALPTLTYSQSIVEDLEILVDSVYQANKKALGVLIHVESPEHGISWTKAFGFADSARTKVLKTDQPVLIASNTKTYVAAAILRLVEDGKISLDDPIRGFLKKEVQDVFEEDGYDLERITVRHLLSHTSGIHDYVDDEYFDLVISWPKYKWHKLEQMLRSVRIGDLLSEPGAAFNYADINYLLLTEIIEEVTKRPFYTAMREMLKYKELGLHHTWFKDLEPSPEGLGAFAHQYANDYQWDSYAIDHSWDLYGGGGMASTVKDAAIFYQHLFAGKVIANIDVLNEMYTYVLPPEESKYCLGLYHFDFGYKLYYHGGWWGTDVNYSPDTNTSIAVFTLVKDERTKVNPYLGKRIQEMVKGR